MANTRKTRLAARKALTIHVEGVGNQFDPEETQVSDLIADLLLLLPPERVDHAVATALANAELDRV